MRAEARPSTLKRLLQTYVGDQSADFATAMPFHLHCMTSCLPMIQSSHLSLSVGNVGRPFAPVAVSKATGPPWRPSQNINPCPPSRRRCAGAFAPWTILARRSGIPTRLPQFVHLYHTVQPSRRTNCKGAFGVGAGNRLVEDGGCRAGSVLPSNPNAPLPRIIL